MPSRPEQRKDKVKSAKATLVATGSLAFKKKERERNRAKARKSQADDPSQSQKEAANGWALPGVDSGHHGSYCRTGAYLKYALPKVNPNCSVDPPMSVRRMSTMGRPVGSPSKVASALRLTFSLKRQPSWPALMVSLR